MKIFLTALLLGFSLSGQGAYRAEGFSAKYDGEERLFLMATFLPYNPSLLFFSADPSAAAACRKRWAKGTFHRLEERQLSSYDLLWVDQAGGEWETLSQDPDRLSTASLVYVSTHGEQDPFPLLKARLEGVGLTLLTRWYWEGGDGHALFMQKNLYRAVMNGLVFFPSEIPSLPVPPPSSELERFFRPALGKSEEHRLDGIDFIYMINLDERPEKFALAARELQLYGINPYRFSAVNGWKLPPATFRQIGASFLPGTLREPLLGSVYKEIEGRLVLHNEWLKEDGGGYFMRALAPGAISIVLSHLSVLQDAYDAGYRTIWVMEDDVEAVADPRQISLLLRSLDRLVPDWDLFFTDTDTKNTEGVHVACRALAPRPNVPIPPLSTFLQKFYPVGGGFHRTGMRYGAYSMIVRRSGMEKILDFYKRYKIFLPYDMDFWLCPDLKMFHYESDIVSHRSGALSDNDAPRYEGSAP